MFLKNTIILILPFPIENKKNLQDDAWRLDQLERSLANPNHAYHKFATGSSVTLRDQPLKEGIDVRKELLKFYERYYSANLMKLCVLGKGERASGSYGR